MAKPKDFHHPFQPYDIQQQFMQAVYDCIEDGKVGIFESPTGTGKSLSLICGSLTWLREHKRKQFDASMQQEDGDDDEPDWLVEHEREEKYKEALHLRQEYEERLEKLRKKEDALRRQAPGPVRKKAKTEQVVPEDDEDLAPEDYDSDTEETTAYSTETTKLLEQLGLINGHTNKGDLADNEEPTKIFFCSRTHSQLSQLVGELKRVRLPSTLPDPQEKAERLKQVALGSRKNLCINPKVVKLSSQTAINERCLELQSSSDKEHKCQFLPKQDNPQALLDFRDSALAKIRDIEDLAIVGSTLEVCPYYASRSAIGPAEMVTLPYPLLLQRTAREALGISLKGSVVIIDEAHNLTAAVESTYSTQVSSTQLQSARSDLIAYLQRFRNKLAGANRNYVTQLVRLLDSMSATTASLRGSNGSLKPTLLLSGKGVDQINLPKLLRYITESKIARKIETYTARKKAGTEHIPDTPRLTQIAGFVSSLLNPASEGNFFWDREGETVQVRYLLLDPSQHFREIVETARAVILAGGTMSPMDDHIQQLFPQLTDVRTLSCGHIIPSSSLLVRAIAKDDIDKLEYNYRTRSDTQLVTRTGKLLLKLARAVQGGMVVFFASYAYLVMVQHQWKASGMLAQLNGAKPLFFDSRTQSAEVTFQAYAEAVRDGSQGALLCSVIGGKLSEGINFSDELGRCVVVVGMPYPNLETAEWKAKIAYLERQAKQPGNISREFAENVCMRAVNQAIGRAIRHKNDWASIVLLDARYTQPRIQAKLPAWIRGSLEGDNSTKVLEADIGQFFNAHTQ